MKCNISMYSKQIFVIFLGLIGVSIFVRYTELRMEGLLDIKESLKAYLMFIIMITSPLSILGFFVEWANSYEKKLPKIIALLVLVAAFIVGAYVGYSFIQYMYQASGVIALLMVGSTGVVGYKLGFSLSYDCFSGRQV